ncbi:PAS domain S-box protein [Mucilaginibacter aquaedulcis]|uniref:PAS domain S-box protein n=1 Tax=Mucilaginibacter aquaedulcis TaxID=1187081 RepID=UPI0025B2B9D6|nr:PAS domain S-box protein [Mucilaginibacter aquaedulcis]MDN3547290.1 PAS domain S-box protein [Mucilaginibacter aquaedulcis]
MESTLTNAQLLWIGSVKGYFFVTINGLFLYLLINSDKKELLRSEQQYRDIYESNPNPMWIYDSETLQIVSVNDAAVASYGYSKKQFLSKSILDIRPAEDAEKTKNAAHEISDKLNQSGRWRHIKQNGQLIDVNITSHKINFSNKQGVLVMAKDITERVQFEEQLEKINTDLLIEKRKLRETQLISKIAGWEYYPENNNLIWSDELYQITGIEKCDPREAFDIYIKHIYPEDRQLMINALQELISNNKPMNVIHRIVAVDGSTRYIRQIAKVDPSDSLRLKILGSLQDVTEFKQLEEERNRYLHSFEHTLNSISDVFFALDWDMKVTRVNNAFLSLFKDHDHIVGEDIFSLFPKEKNKFYPAYQKALESRVIVKLEEYSQILEKWIRLAAYPTDEGVSVYFTDITENKLKDIKLKEAVERYELVAQATHDVVYDMDIVRDHIEYNTSLTHLVEVSPDDIAHNLSWWRSLIHPDDLAEVVSSQEKIRRQGSTNWECEYRINCGSGNYKYVMDQGYYVFNEKKEAVRLIGAIKDIDALKRANRENVRLANIITQVSNMIIITDTDQRITWVNKAFEEMTGYTLNEVAGRFPMEFLGGSGLDFSDLEQLKEKQRKRESFAVDLMVFSKTQVQVWVSAKLSPAYDSSGNYTGYVTICQDVTSRKEKEEEINRQNELLRNIAWMSSHEIRRPVANMIGLISLLNNRGTESEKQEILRLLNQCSSEMDDMIFLIHQKIQNSFPAEIIIPS